MLATGNIERDTLSTTAEVLSSCMNQAAEGDAPHRLDRSPFLYRLLLTPLEHVDGEDRSTMNVIEDYPPILVSGKDISCNGLGFRHTEPIPFRNVLVESADPRLDEQGLSKLRLELSLRWCRFVAPGHYESGGLICWPDESDQQAAS